jgi:eukaryotic-like serine/threonine-protein kinase
MNERDIFDAALAFSDSQQRGAFLEQACGENETLRREIEEMLEAQKSLGSFLQGPPVGLDATVDLPVLEGPGTQVGPYKLLQQIGEGGFGVVYMAEQHTPVRRKVALKVIKAGMDTRLVIARFEAERQALALMDHHNIARVLDAGATSSGRPYFPVRRHSSPASCRRRVIALAARGLRLPHRRIFWGLLRAATEGRHSLQ